MISSQGNIIGQFGGFEETSNANINAVFDIKQAHMFYQNMKRDIYPEIMKYLTGKQNEDQRWLKKSTLEAYKIGVGLEKFRNDHE